MIASIYYFKACWAFFRTQGKRINMSAPINSYYFFLRLKRGESFYMPGNVFFFLHMKW